MDLPLLVEGLIAGVFVSIGISFARIKHLNRCFMDNIYGVVRSDLDGASKGRSKGEALIVAPPAQLIQTDPGSRECRVRASYDNNLFAKEIFQTSIKFNNPRLCANMVATHQLVCVGGARQARQ